MTVPADVTVVGIGADGWAGLGEPGRAAVRGAEVVLGGHRHRTLPSSRSTAISNTTRSGCGCGTR